MELSNKKLSKEEILDFIAKLKKNPNAKYAILADLGIASAGMAGAGAIATVAGSSAVPIGWGITTLTGLTAVATAPVALVVGTAVVGGVAAYGVTQAVRFKARQQGIHEQMLQQLMERLRDIGYEETRSQVTEEDKTKFILFLEEPVRFNLISPEDASDLIQLVENGQITLFEAYRLVKDILDDFNSERGSANPMLSTLLPRATTSRRRSG